MNHVLFQDPKSFVNGLVFGFDIGTGSIGYAVRKGNQFLDVGVLIVPSDVGSLKNRRTLRRQRRTLRSRKRRRQWLSQELEKIGLPRPNPFPHNPVELRLKALNGEILKPTELHAAIAHLFKRRGYTQPPWNNSAGESKNADEEKKEEGKIRKQMSDLQDEMRDLKCEYPCQFLLHPDRNEKNQRRRVWPRELLEKEFRAICKAQGEQHKELENKADWLLFGDLPKIKGHHVYFKNSKEFNPGVMGLKWPRFDNRSPGLDVLEPYRKDTTTGRWIRQHTLKRKHPLFKEWQLEVALHNFTVVRRLPSPGKNRKEKIEKISPPPPALEALRKMWNERGHLWVEDLQEWARAYEGQFELNPKQKDLTPRNDLSGRARFSKHGMAIIRQAIKDARDNHNAAFKNWEQNFKDKNKNATEEDIANGYARFLSQQATSMENIGDNSYARTVCPPLVLMLPHETTDAACRRYISEIRDPLVRHRVELFTRELRRLIKLHGNGQAPEFIVVELARDLMMSEDQKKENDEKNKERKKERDNAAQILREMGFAPDDNNIKKFLLAQEIGWRCPFTHKNFCQSDFSNLTITQIVQAENKPRFVREVKSVFGSLEIEHLVPRTPIVCNEWFNLTVTLASINAKKNKRTPFQWLSVDRDGVPEDLTWDQICKNASNSFGQNSLKYQVFTGPDAALLIEEHAKRSLQQTAYIARCLREVSLILFGKEHLDWSDGMGRDPRLLKANAASSRFLTTNGVITSRLRSAWKLNDILYPRLSDAQWHALSKEQKRSSKEERSLKNRQDHRHHAIDAMVIACTLPWLAFKSKAGDNQSENGWCEVDKQTGAITKIWNPVFNDYGHGIRQAAEEKCGLLLRFSKNQKVNLFRNYKPTFRKSQFFDTTLYGKRDKFEGDELGQTLFVARKPLLELKTSHLNSSSTGGFIFSRLLREYIKKEWDAYSAKEENWQHVRNNWIKIFERQLDELRASGKNDDKTRKSIKAKEARIKKLNQMDFSRGWDDLLKFIDKELGSQQPQPRFPSEFVQTLRHPVYSTPITSVKVTAQSKDEDSFLLVKKPDEKLKARSGTYVMRKQEDKYREMRVYKLARPNRKRNYVCWLVLPWYEKFDSWSDRFKKASETFMPSACKGAQLIQTFRKGDIVCFTNDSLAEKGINQGESWTIIKTDARGDSLANIGLLPAHLARQSVHPITEEKVKLEPVTVSLNDFMRALEGQNPTDEPPHRASDQPATARPG